MDDEALATTITCRTCGETKAITEYDRRNDSTKRHRMCKPCRRTYQRERWQCANPPRPERSKRVVGSLELFTCSRCGRELAADAFAYRVTGSPILQSWCRACFSAYKSARYFANREHEVIRLRRNHRALTTENKMWLREYLMEHPCVDCAETDADVLEFDHLRDKRMDVTRMVAAGYSRKLILSEIDKCEVRCANCHRRKTRERIRIAKQAISDAATPGGDSNARLNAGSKPAALSTERRGRTLAQLR